MAVGINIFILTSRTTKWGFPNIINVRLKKVVNLFGGDNQTIYICPILNGDRNTIIITSINFFITNHFKFIAMSTSMFSFSVATPKSKGELSNVPELMATVTKDKIRLNGALTRKLLLQSGDRLMFISNEQAVLNAVAAGKVDEKDVKGLIQYAIAKSVPVVDDKGQIKTSIRRLSKEESDLLEQGKLDCELDKNGRPIETAFYGFKLASTTGTAGYGQILEGSDATHWPALDGNENSHKVYTLGDAVEVEVSGETVTAYALVYDRDEAKAERIRGGKTQADTSSIEDEDEEMA